MQFPEAPVTTQKQIQPTLATPDKQTGSSLKRKRTTGSNADESSSKRMSEKKKVRANDPDHSLNSD